MCECSTIVSLSYGEDRTFLLNRMIRKIGNKIHSIQLKPGNIVLMSKASQYIWQHSVPKDSRVSGTETSKRKMRSSQGHSCTCTDIFKGHRLLVN